VKRAERSGWVKRSVTIQLYDNESQVKTREVNTPAWIKGSLYVHNWEADGFSVYHPGVSLRVVRTKSEADALRIGDALQSRFCLILRKSNKEELAASFPAWAKNWIKGMEEAGSWLDLPEGEN
jgi:hypothetical protein